MYVTQFVCDRCETRVESRVPAAGWISVTFYTQTGAQTRHYCSPQCFQRDTAAPMAARRI